MMLGEINEFSGTLWATQIKIAAAQKPAAIFVVINSPGGHADEGVRILSEMRQAAANGSPVVCKVQGQAGSMAAAILEAGCARRQMTAGSVLMFHEICFNGPPKFPNPHRILRQDLQHFANELEDDNMKIAVLSAPRLKFTAAQFAQWISDHDRYLGAPEALDLGAIDEVVP
jgi:ATP-dependent protease ClpP protease subunit